MLALTLLSGCTFISDPVSRMKTPRLSEDKATLMAAINSLKLVRPTNDDDSSIRTEDLNGDGVEESLVFYETPGEAVQIHGMILAKQGDSWVKKLTFDGAGTVLESVEIRDVTGDGIPEIVVGYSRGDEGLQKGLVVYSYSGNTLEEKLTLSYTKYVIDDLNGDGKDDITVVSLKRNESSTLTTYQYSSGAFKELDRLENLDPYINNYYNIVVGKVAQNKEGIVLDAAVNSHSAYSYMVVMENNRFRVVLSGDDHTFKDSRIPSTDIDGDGIIEIGLMERPSGWEDVDADAIPWFYSYYKWNGKEGLIFALQQYRDPSDRYTLDFPPSWHGKVTVDPKSVQNQYLRFILSDTGETVAEISFFSAEEWDLMKGNGWQLWGRDADRIIAYRGKLEQNANGIKKGTATAPGERKGINE
ncbi:FG-GAP repeat protein [compost metagenome]